MLAYAKLKLREHLLHSGQALLGACVLAAAVDHRAGVEAAHMAPELRGASAEVQHIVKKNQTVSDWSQT
jgi:hypothetical protein